ncbi:MAG: hypothetical protein H0U71_08225 [Gammaproteobacteria bacterium]|nr:hypothetical protein [Gammaproteobacteria bacterium]
MNQAKGLSISRLFFLNKIELQQHRNGILVVTAAIIIFHIINYFLAIMDSFSEYSVILFFGGIVVTAASFKDIHDRKKAQLFLMIPGSNLEKMITKWLASSIMYVIFTLIVYLGLSLLDYSLIDNSSYNQNQANFFHYKLLPIILSYLALQPIIFLGSITFRKYVVLKTLLLLTVIIFSLIAFVAFIAWLMYCKNCFVPVLLPSFIHSINFFELFVYYSLAPFCLYMTYLKLNEFELP